MTDAGNADNSASSQVVTAPGLELQVACWGPIFLVLQSRSYIVTQWDWQGPGLDQFVVFF